MRATILLLLAASLTAVQGASVWADSLLDAYAPQHATIVSTMTFQYIVSSGSPVGPDTSSIAYSSNLLANPTTGPSFDAFAEPSELFPYAGASGNPSDVSIEGSTNLNLSFGAPVTGSAYPNDTFNFRVQGTVDSTGAIASDGEPAIASVDAESEATFWLDAAAAGVPEHYRLGTLVIDSFTFDPNHEDVTLSMLDTDSYNNSYLFTRYAPMADKHEIPLYADHEYKLSFSYYTDRYPNEVQPYSMVFSANMFLEPYDGPQEPGLVPEPATILLALFGLALLPRRRRR